VDQPGALEVLDVLRRDLAERREAPRAAWRNPTLPLLYFGTKVHPGALELDNYTELTFQTTRYAYNTLGALTTVTDTLGVTTVMTYDALGRKMAMRDPDMGLWSYQYDPAGNLTQQTDARGCVITFGYDPLNRLTGKSYSGSCSGVPVAYTYDAYDGTTQFGRGQRTGMTDATGSTAWTYDVRGRVTREVKPITGVGAFTTTTTYDALDRVVTQT